MRVDIGPYTSRWRSMVYDRYMTRRYGYNWPAERDQTAWERRLEKLEDGLQWIYNHSINLWLDRRRRKILVRIDDSDVWSMDHTLALVVLPMLRKLKDAKAGSPLVDDSDAPSHLSSTAAEAKENEWDIDSNHHARWDWVLDEMIFAFESIVDDSWEDQFHTGKIDFVHVPTDAAGNTVDPLDATLWRLEKSPLDTSHWDRDGYAAYQARISNGLRLFGVYYQALWS